MKKLALPLLSVLISASLFAQMPTFTEQGFPFIRNYAAADYKAHAQNFAIVRDPGGILYAGNFAGVLQYDGEYWRLIPTARTSRVSALGLDDSGRVFVGGLGEIGYLEATPTGDMVFRSLSDSAALPPFQDVLQICTSGEEVWFITRTLILRWNGERLDHWIPGGEVIAGFTVEETLYLQIKNEGLMQFRNGKPEAIPGGNTLTGAIEIRSMLPYPGNEILIATGTQGLYRMDNSGIRTFNTPSDPLFLENLITACVPLSDGTFAVGTTRKGILIIRPDGSVSQIIDKKASLRNEYVQALFAGDDNLLWAALNNGIALIEAPSALTSFDDKAGLNGAVIQVLRHSDRLYVSTYQGLYWYDSQAFEFKPVTGILTACWSMVPFGQDLLAATSQGLFQVSGSTSRLIRDGFTLSMQTDSENSRRLYVSTMGAFAVLDYQNGIWKTETLLPVEGEIRNLQQDKTGTLWGSTLSHGVFRFNPVTGQAGFLDTSAGLPESDGATINKIAGEVYVSTRKGIFWYHSENQTFEQKFFTPRDTTAEEPWYSLIRENGQGDLWVTGGDESGLMLLRKNAGSYTPDPLPFLPIAGYAIWDVFTEASGVSWFGGPDGLIRYDQRSGLLKAKPLPVKIRKISTAGDSLIFAGNRPPGDPISPESHIFRYQDNSLRFEYALPFCSAKGDNLYQYRLEGFEVTWSDWTPGTQKEYTNLPEGKYTFHVRGRNVYGLTEGEDLFRFTILAPWYATVWAWLAYALLAAGGIYLIVIVRNRQLMKEKRVLEQRIAERTAEVVQQKEEIVKQSDELAGKNEELEKINTTVKSINSEIKFENLLQSLLEKMRVIRSVEKSSALVFDTRENSFRFKATYGWDLDLLDQARVSLDQAEQRYITGSQEIFEDIFLKTDFAGWERLPGLTSLAKPKTMLIMVIRVENRVEAFLILENLSRENAFEARDLSFIRNSKEHIISAFIRTRILEDLQQTLQNLKETQDQLVQSEKLASLGALIAGIAHEIQNPLNFVNNFSSLSADLAGELMESISGLKDKIDPDTYADMEEVTGMIRGNVTKIHDHGKRAESIVKGMLQHSRGRSGEFEQVTLNTMVSEYVNLAYHGMRAKDKNFNTSIKTQLDPEVGKVSIIPQDLSRVILNIVNNSCYALDEKIKKNLSGYSPEVVVSTRKIHDKVEIRIRDNGTGIPAHVKEKIFNPFFTTKPTGQGTGLGLSLSFDIVTQLHKGKLEVDSKEGEYTEFIITIPEKQS